MDDLQARIVQMLGKRGPLSQSQLYEKLYPHKAQKKNDAIEKLLSSGLIKKDFIKLNTTSKKSACYLSLTLFGVDFFSRLERDKNLI